MWCFWIVCYNYALKPVSVVRNSGLISHSSSAVATQMLSSVNELKSESVQSNGASKHSLLADHLDSNGCNLTDTHNSDRNGSVNHQHDCQSLDSPTKKCRTESESLAQVETDPSRVKEDWETKTKGQAKILNWGDGTGLWHLSPYSP